VFGLINSLVSNIQDIVVSLGYPGILLASFAENFFPPLPSEVIFPFVGFVSGVGRLELFLVIIFGTLGALLGAILWYGIGYVLGSANLKIYIDRYGHILRISFKDIEKAESWFAKHGASVVFFGRLIPIVRTLISVPAGFVRMPFLKFLAYSAFGSVIWIGLLTSAGFLLGERWGEVSQIVESYELLVGVILILTVLLGIFVLYRRRFKNR